MEHAATDSITGTVVSASGDRCKVECAEAVLDCRLKRSKDARMEPVVGDHVRISSPNHGISFLEQILPRRSTLSRRNPRPPCDERVITANVDRAVIVVTLKDPPLRVKLIDRYLVAAQIGGVTPVICVNKIDLLSPDEPKEPPEVTPYKTLGIDVVACSAAAGVGLDELASVLAHKTCVFVGHSGVGKSSIINALGSGLRLAVNSTRKHDGKGRHTTTASTLYHLARDITVIDTPGIREFGLYGVGPDELRGCFSEFDEFAGGCRYADCTHVREPECSVRTAVRDGLVPRVRYESYCRLMEDMLPGGAGVEPLGSTGDSFECRKCGSAVTSGGAGSEHRNHCPSCLHSVHLDNEPGDRAACCGGLMEPVSVWTRKGGEWAVIHRCCECGRLSSNRIAADDNEMLLLSLAVRPLSQPPFPLEGLGRERKQ